VQSGFRGGCSWRGTALLSVVIPSDEDVARLRTCLEAIVAQTRRDLDLVIVDDGGAKESVTLSAVSRARRTGG
jgi:hypothetical protein